MRARYSDRLEAARASADAEGVGAHATTAVDAGAARWPLAAALLIAVAAGSAGYLVGSYLQRAPRTEASFVLNAIGAHSVYVPEVRHPVEVKADEEHLIRWLTGASARRSAPSLVDRGWKLMGGRLLPTSACPRRSSCTRTPRVAVSRALYPQGDGPQQHSSSLPSGMAWARSIGSTGRSPMRLPAGSARGADGSGRRRLRPARAAVR